MAHAQTQAERAAPRQSVLGRVIRPEEDDLSPEAAQSILRLRFQDKDLERMHELTVKNQRGELSDAEAAELSEFRQVGLLIDLLRSKARLSLKRLGLSPVEDFEPERLVL